MDEISVLRRAFWTIRDRPYPASSTAFANLLGKSMLELESGTSTLTAKGCNVQKAASIEKKLKEEGLIASVPGKSRKKSDKSKARKVVVNEAVSTSRAKPDGLLNPLAYIRHHVSRTLLESHAARS